MVQQQYSSPSAFGATTPKSGILPGGSVYTAGQEQSNAATAKQSSLIGNKKGGKRRRVLRGGLVQLTPMRVPYPEPPGGTSTTAINNQEEVIQMQAEQNAVYDNDWKKGGSRKRRRHKTRRTRRMRRMRTRTRKTRRNRK